MTASAVNYSTKERQQRERESQREKERERERERESRNAQVSKYVFFVNIFSEMHTYLS